MNDVLTDTSSAPLLAKKLQPTKLRLDSFAQDLTTHFVRYQNVPIILISKARVPIVYNDPLQRPGTPSDRHNKLPLYTSRVFILQWL